jgi:hypothetical protein
LSLESKDALWARFCMGAPRRQRRSVKRYNIVKRLVDTLGSRKVTVGEAPGENKGKPRFSHCSLQKGRSRSEPFPVRPVPPHRGAWQGYRRSFQCALRTIKYPMSWPTSRKMSDALSQRRSYGLGIDDRRRALQGASHRIERNKAHDRRRGWKGRAGANAKSRLKPPDQENPIWPCTSSASLRSGPEPREWHYGQRRMKSRTYRSDTLPHQPATAEAEGTRLAPARRP